MIVTRCAGLNRWDEANELWAFMPRIFGPPSAMGSDRHCPHAPTPTPTTPRRPLLTPVRIKCLPTDTVGDLKKLIAAQTGTNASKIQLKKWYTTFKDHIALQDYEINDGMVSPRSTEAPQARSARQCKVVAGS